MADKFINFLSYNPTGSGPLKTRFIRDLSSVGEVSFIQLQEHFRKSSNITQYFKQQFPDFNSYIIPGYRKPGQDNGRPIGGLAQMSTKLLKINKIRIKTTSPRIQAQVLQLNNTKLMWLNAYLPCDSGPTNIDELNEVLGEIENILDTSQYDDVIWGGDLNWHKDRNSSHSNIMQGFIDRLGLTSVWEKFPCDFTHRHTDNKSFSSIDHFIVNPRLLNHIESCAPVHLIDNLSRHAPIMLKLKVNEIPSNKTVNIEKPRKPSWYKANQRQVKKYTNDLDHKIQNINPPECLECTNVNCDNVELHSQERDNYLVDLLSAAIESMHENIPLSGKKPPNKPNDNCPVTQCIPGWKEQVKEQRDTAIFWHSIYLSMGRPNRGIVYNIMCRTRNLYHYAIRKVKRQAAEIRSRKLIVAANNGDANLLKEMKKIKGGYKETIDLPEQVDNVEGEEEIANKVREVYSSLYNSAETTEAMDTIKNKINEMIGPESLLEVGKVTGAVLKRAAGKMKPGKNDVSDSFKSDLLLHSPDSMFDALAAVFRSWLIHGTVSRHLLATAFLPFLKCSLKDPADSDSYRAIAGSSQILKLFDYVILDLWGHLLDSDSLQMGFKGGVSTTHCSYLVQEVAGYYLRRGSNIFATCCDCSKAFDKCRFDLLFTKLIRHKVPAIVIRILIFNYEKQFAWIKWGNTLSQQFGVSNGTKQGSVVSPIFWNLYLDDLLKKLRTLGVGCFIAGVFVGATAYADDLLLLSPTRSGMEAMLKLCEKFAAEHNISFSVNEVPAKSKTKVVYMCGSMDFRDYPAPLKLNGTDLPYVTTCLHLGHILAQDGTMVHDCKAKRAQYIDKTVDIRTAFKFADPVQVLTAMDRYVGNHYGSMLYDLYDDSSTGQYFRCWGTAVKLAWDCPRSTHRYFIRSGRN